MSVDMLIELALAAGMDTLGLADVNNLYGAVEFFVKCRDAGIRPVIGVHLEKDGAANWYQAMQDVYPKDTLEKFFTWQKMRQLGEDPYLIALKGVPLPLEVRPWWALVIP